MQYIIGFLSAFVFLYALVKIQDKYNILRENYVDLFVPSQSRNHELFNKHLQNKEKMVKPKTQSQLHDQKTNIRVIIMDDQAYWIKDNVFYMADMYDGNVDKDTTRVVDTMAMDKVQLDKMMFIIDRLREGTFNDSGSTGN